MSVIGTIIDFSKVCFPTVKTKACDTSGGTSTPDPVKFTQGIQNSVTDTSINDVTLPAGAYYVSIRPLYYNKPITINGESYYLGEEFNRQVMENKVTCIQDFLKAITIVSNGNAYDITIAYPSDHTVNLSTVGL